MKPTEGKILVTGAAGFIGSALIWALNQQGKTNIIACDRLGTDEKWKNLVGLQYDDYVDADDLAGWIWGEDGHLSGLSLIVHLGACSATTETDASYLMRNNYEYTKTLAEFSLANNIRFVYASSAATYGDGAQGMDDKDEDLTRLRPLNMYGYSKHFFDVHAMRHGWLDHMVGMKYFNVFGPNEHHKGDMRSVVAKSYRRIADMGNVELFRSHRPDYRDGEQMRDFLYVKDAVSMTLHLADTREANGLFNLGSGVASTWIQLVTPIFETIGKPVDIRFIPMPDHLQGKYQYYTCAAIEKLRSTGYDKPVTPLPEAVADYVGNYLLPERLLEV